MLGGAAKMEWSVSEVAESARFYVTAWCIFYGFEPPPAWFSRAAHRNSFIAMRFDPAEPVRPPAPLDFLRIRNVIVEGGFFILAYPVLIFACCGRIHHPEFGRQLCME